MSRGLSLLAGQVTAVTSTQPGDLLLFPNRCPGSWCEAPNILHWQPLEREPWLEKWPQLTYSAWSPLSLKIDGIHSNTSHPTEHLLHTRYHSTWDKSLGSISDQYLIQEVFIEHLLYTGVVLIS